MKLVTLAIVFGSGAAFSPSKPIASAGRCQRGPSQIESTAEAADSKSAVGEISSYDKIGFAEDKIAIGINPDDVAEWIGGRDQLIEKFKADNPNFDQERVEMEVDKFMMDVEMVNLYMAYNKKKAEDPDFGFGGGPDQSLSTYAVWIFGGFGLASLKNNFIDPKFASGEWDKLAIPDPLHLFDAAGAAATAATP